MTQNKPTNLFRSWALTSLLAGASLSTSGCSDQDAPKDVDATQSQTPPASQLIEKPPAKTPDKETLSAYMRTVEEVDTNVLVITQDDMDHIANTVRENLNGQDMEEDAVEEIIYAHQIELIKHAYEKVGVFALDEEKLNAFSDEIRDLTPEQQAVMKAYATEKDREYLEREKQNFEAGIRDMYADKLYQARELIAKEQWKRLQECPEIEISPRTGDMSYIQKSMYQSQKDCALPSGPE